MEKNNFENLLKIGIERRATKKYIKDKIIPREDIDKLYEFVKTAPHSIGMELCRIINISSNSKFKESIASHLKSTNKDRAMDASDLVILVTKTENFFSKKNKEFTNRMKDITKYHLGLNKKPYILGMEKIFISQFLKGSFANQQNNNEEWSSKQAYIQLAYILLGAASLNINTTPLEGFESSINEHLKNIDLIKDDEKVSLCVLMGYADKNDPKTFTGDKQFRKPINQLVSKY